MRILLTVHQFFPEYSAGTEVLTLSVAKKLLALGHEVHIYSGHPGDTCTSDDQRLEEYVYDGIAVSRFLHAYVPMAGQTSMIEIGYKNVLALQNFDNVVRQFNPDYVHHFHLNRLGIGLIDFLHQQGIAQFFTPTDFWMICPTAQLMLGEGRYCSGPDHNAGNCVKHFSRDRLKGLSGKIIDNIPDIMFSKLALITKKNPIIQFPMSQEVRALTDRLTNTVAALNKLDGIVSPNAFMKELFIKYGVKESLIHSCQFGVDINNSYIKQEASDNIQPVICLGFIGTLAPHKGCHIAIKAFLDLPVGSARLKIYGSHKDFPDYYENLIKLVNNNPDIEFCGTFHNENIGEIIAQFDVLLVPSVWYENTPLVIYSAQACQCPVIASNLPGISEIVHDEENGLLFNPGDSADLNKCIQRIIARAELLPTFRKNCCAPLSVEQYTLKLLDIWCKC